MLSTVARSEVTALSQRLLDEGQLSRDDWWTLLSLRKDGQVQRLLAEKAHGVCEQTYGRRIFLRGLIEFTNICKNDCYYCGIRRGNAKVERYRLTAEDVLACCAQGYALGFRTFVLQGGEDAYWSDERLVPLLEAISARHPDCALTLSLGERSRESYRRLYAAGARRYLLRHETATEAHYRRLHPAEMSLENRLTCLRDLKELGYQVGCGIMVGSPGQDTEQLVNDFMFMQTLQPHMVGIGPFIPHQDTPFCHEAKGSVEETLVLLSLLRLMLPQVLLPATTALGTVADDGRERGIAAGANVIMPNLSPQSVRKKYQLYDGKLATGSEAAESVQEIRRRLQAIGYEGVVDRGDHPLFSKTS